DERTSRSTRRSFCKFFEEILKNHPMAENYKNILVTGGCGFIGSNFVRHLYAHYPEYRIFNVDALTYAGNLENLCDIEQKESELESSARRYQFLKGDICDALFLENLFSQNR